MDAPRTATAADLLADAVEIDGGYCIKRVSDRHCVDVLRMMHNWRVTRTERPAGVDEHGYCGMDRGYCYFGHGHDAAGSPRTMTHAKLRAIAAALAWDGADDTAPEGFDKDVFNPAPNWPPRE